MKTPANLLALGLAAVVIAVDQATKARVVLSLGTQGATQRLPGPIDLTLSFNRSNAFSVTPVVGDLTRWALTGFNLAIAAGLLIYLFRNRLRLAAQLGVALVMAGAIGNALDRLRFGAVVDFLDASKIGFIWIFNVADASVDVGLALLALSLLSTRPPETARNAP